MTEKTDGCGVTMMKGGCGLVLLGLMIPLGFALIAILASL